MRYEQELQLDMEDLVTLLSVYRAFVNDPSLGEMSGVTHYSKMIQELNKQCKIVISPAQLWELQNYYKTAVMERMKMFKFSMPREYQTQMERLRKQHPDLFYKDRDGEIIMKDSKDILRDE